MKLNPAPLDTEKPLSEETDGESKPKRAKKKPEPEGSRWGALILLIIVLVLGLAFYIKGEWGREETAPVVQQRGTIEIK